MRETTNRQMPAYKMRRSGIILIAAGVFFVTGLLLDVTSWKMFYKNPVEVKATVVRNIEYSSKNGSTYTPCVDYEYNGIKVTDTAVKEIEVRHAPVEIGSELTLTVNGNDPKKQLSQPSIMTYVFSALSFFVISIGVLMLKSAKNAPEY